METSALFVSLSLRASAFTIRLMPAAYAEAKDVTESIHFDDAKTGALPAGWKSGVTGSGSAKWTVETNATAPSKPNVLKQSGAGTFLWCVKNEPAIANGYVDVKFKPVAGKEDQAAGVIWRLQDANN